MNNPDTGRRRQTQQYKGGMDMAYQTVFKRYELKYMITREQQAKILKAMEPYMVSDKFGKSTIRNIYFDTDDYILARHSIAKPDFKEKLRIRSYSAATSETTVFVELKRKFDHVVYKRRVALPENEAMNWTQGFSRRNSTEGNAPVIGCGKNTANSSSAPVSGQMTREIDYFLSYYGYLKPAVFLSYDRQAFKMRELPGTENGHGMDFRVTFDENIRFRDYDISLRSDVYGESLLEEGKVLMELKCSGGLPLWMTEILSEEHIYKTSFSKYGTAYTRYIQPEQQRRIITARVPEAAAEHSSSGTGAGKSRKNRRLPKHAAARTASSWLRYLGA